jgi:hypothetical protein
LVQPIESNLSSKSWVAQKKNQNPHKAIPGAILSAQKRAEAFQPTTAHLEKLLFNFLS